ncbi:MAG TPA: glycosyltransferase, partial [Acidobacteriota bacterium]
MTAAIPRASIVTVSSRALQKRFGGEILRHGCDTDFFDPKEIDSTSARKMFRFSQPTILFPGVVRAHKGFNILAAAVQQIANARLAVTCGEDDFLEPEWSNYPLHKLFFVPYSSLPKLLAAADVIAIPQLDTEAARHQVPMKVFEAMSMAKPVVASAVGDLPEILADCGRIVPPADVHALRDSLLEILENATLARKLGEDARNRCEQHYSLQAIGEQLRQLCSRLSPIPTTHVALKKYSALQINVDAPGQIFSDMVLPFLARALDPWEVQKQLELVLPHAFQPFAVKAIRVKKYKPGRRCVVEYDLDCRAHERITVIGKSRKKRGEINHQVLDALHHAGFDSTSSDGISVPQAFGYIPEFRMSLQEKVSGVEATKLLASGEQEDLAAKIAEAIHKLHLCGVSSPRRHTLDEEMAILNNRLSQVGKAKPEWKMRIDRLLGSCFELANTIVERRAFAIHRDFYSDQIIVSPDRIYLVDLDLYSEGEPALDAGNFLGHTTEQRIRHPEQEKSLLLCEQAFETRFLELDRDSTSSYVDFYKTFTLARHIYLSTQYRERHA